MPTTQISSLTDVYRRVVESACLAPSAENLQPWHFVVGDEGITICLDSRRSLASDVGGMLGLTGIGACLENAIIAARAENLEPTINWVFDHSELNDVAGQWPIVTLRFSEPGQADPLFSEIVGRCTSRRMERIPVDRSVLEEIGQEAHSFQNIRLNWVTDDGEMRELGKLVGMGNRIRFEHQPFHEEFYHNVRFTRDEAESTRDGLDLASLQLPSGVTKILAYLRKWPRMRIANLAGFSHGVARQAAQEVRSSGALGVLTVGAPTPENLVEGGRALERIWLATTAAALGFHPAAALPVFLAYAQRTDVADLLPRHRRMAQRMQQRFFQLYPRLSGRTVQMVFRVGHAQRPTVRSLRRNAAEFLT